MEARATHEYFQVTSGGGGGRKNEWIIRINIYPIYRGFDAWEVFFQICIRVADVSVGEGASEGIVWKRVRVAKKACEVGCIGCGKCVKACPFEAITLENNLAYIDFEKCRLCRKCVDECPQHSILAVNFPPKKVVEPQAEAPVADAAPVADPAPQETESTENK